MAETWGEDAFLGDYEDIACQDLPAAFGSFIQKTSAGQQTTQAVLSETTNFLQSSQQAGQISQDSLQSMIQSLEQQRIFISADKTDWLFQLEDIAYFTKECLNKGKVNPPPNFSYPGARRITCPLLSFAINLHAQNITVHQIALEFGLSYLLDQFRQAQEKGVSRSVFSDLIRNSREAQSFAESNRQSLKTQGLHLLEISQSCL